METDGLTRAGAVSGGDETRQVAETIAALLDNGTRSVV